MTHDFSLRVSIFILQCLSIILPESYLCILWFIRHHNVHVSIILYIWDFCHTKSSFDDMKRNIFTTLVTIVSGFYVVRDLYHTIALL